MFGSGSLGMGVTFSLNNQASAPAAAAASSINTLAATVTRAQETIGNFANRITNGFAGVAIAVTMLMAPFAAAMQASSEFNFQVTRSISLAGQGLEQTKMLREEAFRLGSVSAFNATQIAEASAELSQSGFMIEQQLKMLPSLTSMATAGMVDLKYAASLASDVMFQYGKSVEDIPNIGDVIVEAANRSNMTVENFGQAIKYFGPSAKLFGVSLEESAAYIEMMANSGMRGSIGTRAFGTSLANLAHPTQQASELMKGYGFGAYDAQGKFKGLEAIVRNLQSSVSGLTNKQRDAFLSIVFGNEAIQEITQLLTLEFKTIEDGTEVVYKGADALKYFTQKNFEAAGTADRVSKGIMNNLKGDLRLLSSAFETLKIKIGDVNEGPLRILVQRTREWVASMTEFIDTRIGQWLVGAATAAATTAAAFAVLGYVTTILIPSIWGMVTAFGALLIELAPVIAVAMAIVGVIYIIKRSFDEFFAVMDGGSKASGFIGILQKIGGVLYSVYEIWTSWNGETFTLSSKLHDALKKIGILEFVLSLATWIVRIKEFWKGFVEGAVFAYVILEQTVSYMVQTFDSLFTTLEQLGIPMSKLIGDMELFRWLGRAVAFGVFVMLTPFILLAGYLTAVSTALEFVIANFNELIKLVPGFGQLYGLYDAIQSGDWRNLSGISLFYKLQNTTGNANVRESEEEGGMFNLDNIRNRQSEILNSFGMGASAAAPPPAASNGGKGDVIQNIIYLDSEKISDTVWDKMNLANARK